MKLPHPKARPGLLIAEQARRGRRTLTALEPTALRVTVLEPWEHAVLVLCNGARSAEEIASIVKDLAPGETIDRGAVENCLEFFKRQQLFEIEQPSNASEPTGSMSKEAAEQKASAQGRSVLAKDPPPKDPGPRTLAALQTAYREWHSDRSKTGQVLLGAIPFPSASAGPGLTPGLEPTVALADTARKSGHRVGSMLVVAPASSSGAGLSSERAIPEPSGPSKGSSTILEEIESLFQEISGPQEIAAYPATKPPPSRSAPSGIAPSSSVPTSSVLTSSVPTSSSAPKDEESDTAPFPFEDCESTSVEFAGAPAALVDSTDTWPPQGERKGRLNPLLTNSADEIPSHDEGIPTIREAIHRLRANAAGPIDIGVAVVHFRVLAAYLGAASPQILKLLDHLEHEAAPQENGSVASASTNVRSSRLLGGTLDLALRGCLEAGTCPMCLKRIAPLARSCASCLFSL